MPSQRLMDYLDQHSIKYTIMRHSLAYTAQEIAAASHIPGKIFAKTVMINVKGKLSMAVLPASYKIDFDRLKKAIGCDSVRLAHEKEFLNLFPDCEVGAMPPFGNLYGMDVYVAQSIADEAEIAFNSCTHSELLQMRYKEFEKLVKPKVVKFSFQSKL
ncbi:MAG TPA: YbaK/EbsC family protein [Ignavibacteriaceae bacterium]|nr:YbaK/EbsC family protein [Ignavibacteriaceae bacterium]